MVIFDKSVERFLNSCQFFDSFWTVAGFDKRWERREGRLKGWGFLFSCFLDLFCAILFQKITHFKFSMDLKFWWNHLKILWSRAQLACLGIAREDTLTLWATPGRNKNHRLDENHGLSLHSGAMWALGLVVLLVTVAGVLALLVYVLKWWHFVIGQQVFLSPPKCFTRKYILPSQSMCFSGDGHHLVST